MPVKVEQINEYLFSDTVHSQKTKSGSDEISQGQVHLCLVNQNLKDNSDTCNPFGFLRGEPHHGLKRCRVNFREGFVKYRLEFEHTTA